MAVTNYADLQLSLATGWNTWNTRSVLSHVLMPQGFALNLGIKDTSSGAFLGEALVGKMGKTDERIHPGPHAYDGSYTELLLRWRDMAFKVQTATDDADLLILVTPLEGNVKHTELIVDPVILWNRDGTIGRRDGVISACLPEGTEVQLHPTCPGVYEPNVPVGSPFLALPLAERTGLATGRPRTIEEIAAVVDKNSEALTTRKAEFKDLGEVYSAFQTCMAWDTIYEPEAGRVISPVSRLWNCGPWGGFVLFCWDTYFAAAMAAVDNRDLAYANAIEITREVRDLGFVPNFTAARNLKSRDRSQPPVGSIVCMELFRQFGDKWFLEELFDDLLTWNRWWQANRDTDGYLCWGSNPFQPTLDFGMETLGINQAGGSILESGLDNSPMYDDAVHDPERHQLRFADVGLMGLYVADCRALAEAADELGRSSEAEELRARADVYSAKLSTMWSEEHGMFLNRDLATGDASLVLSPTNFYPLIGKVATQAQAERMMTDHFYNPEEFWGEWIMPSIARNAPGYGDQSYWRGRVWAPMNYLVSLGLRNYDLPKARKDLADRSASLLLKEWLENGHVHENYNSDTGEGCDVSSSDRFYHWGGLLGLIALKEQKDEA